MAGRNIAHEALAPKSEAPTRNRRLACDTAGCDQPADVRVEGGRNLCHRCDEGDHNRRAFEHCKALGLHTVEDMKRFVREKARAIFRHAGNGEDFLENMKQPTVEVMLRMATETDRKLLERMRSRCIIDAQNKVIDPEKRPALRAQRAARIEEERRRAEAVLAMQKATLEAKANEERQA